MQIQIPIPSLFTQVFGISGILMSKFKPPDEENQDPEMLTSNLGTPVQFPMGLVGSNYNVRQNGRIVKKFIKGVWLPFTSVASFSRAKRTTETYMSGQNGSIIEEYGFEPWEIRVQGFIIKNDKALIYGDSTVEDQIRELLQWEGLSDAVGVKGRAFEVRNIHKVAILGITFPDARGSNIEVIQPYEMKLRSVEPIELTDL
jgi:hypothetical protein